MIFDFFRDEAKSQSKREFTVKRLQDIESGRSLPTFEEFFKLCILYDMEECVNLKELYPGLYQEYYSELATRSYRYNLPFKKRKGDKGS